MSKVHQCDRCGAVASKMGFFKRSFFSWYRPMSVSHLFYKQIELCDNCLYEFNTKFMRIKEAE